MCRLRESQGKLSCIHSDPEKLADSREKKNANLKVERLFCAADQKKKQPPGVAFMPAMLLEEHALGSVRFWAWGRGRKSFKEPWQGADAWELLC
ncbi:hypothetical protein NDU88_007388 [Pleurodeles waltl]|uniref:Uncharacterized protein n=1 Tax=Pleurodeles waltl TaxID=8319 RepID=A0AAV7N1X2_PLEWA|nr:hypothetical protein NDU88_007388 [Pleurodeles waltl]